MKYLVLSAFLVSLSAQAHIEPGLYTGTTPSGDACSMIAGATTFPGGMHHPLTERFALEVESIAFSAGHPATLDVTNSAVTFNHDLVQAINATSEGAVALSVVMVHTEAFEGPGEYTFINHNWKAKTKAVIHCQNLTLTTLAL